MFISFLLGFFSSAPEPGNECEQGKESAHRKCPRRENSGSEGQANHQGKEQRINRISSHLIEMIRRRFQYRGVKHLADIVPNARDHGSSFRMLPHRVATANGWQIKKIIARGG